ncbi:unnamed protein product [Rotaria sp. Silwood1]|nr:unnamed protein product [Rotaria sp. Silwood1]
MYPCDNILWDYTKNGCGYANCYLIFDKFLATFDCIFNGAVPTVLNALANILLFMRFILQKRRMRQTMNWQRQRRMATRLFYVSSIYIVAFFPPMIVSLVQILGYPNFLVDVQNNYLNELISSVEFVLPWIYLILFSESLNWIKTLYRRRLATVAALTTR